MSDLILSVNNITVRKNDQTIFDHLSFQIRKGEQWVLIGESGSGKTALLQTIAGRLGVSRGNITYHFYEEIKGSRKAGETSFSYHNLIGFVSSKYGFRNLSNTTDFYYQQRFNSADSEDSLTVEEYISKIRPGVDWSSFWTAEQTIGKLNLTPLLAKQLIKLSNGETKRLLIAAALLKQPAVLLLDNPLTGLDVATRAYFNKMLSEIAASGITVMLTASPGEIPEAITHVAIMKQGQISDLLPKQNFDAAKLQFRTGGRIDLAALRELLAIKSSGDFTEIVQMREVTVRYGDKTILDKVNWEVRQGEHWALLGPNGAGKSTLLSLINGDNPQAYANHIVLFDRRRGSGESIWDIKSKIGFVSPELHQYFPTDNNCLQVIESGFYDTLGMFRPSIPQNAAIAGRWMELLELEEYVRQPLKNLSASTQRRVLLARALVKNPPLLIFDEPCQGLDAYQQQHFKNIVDAICQMGSTTLIYVSHYAHEIPDSVTKVLRLNEGKVVDEI